MYPAKINCYLKTILEAIALDWSSLTKEAQTIDQCNAGYEENYSTELGIFEYLADKKKEFIKLELHYLVSNQESKVTIHLNYCYADNGDTECYKTVIMSIDNINDITNIPTLLRTVSIYSANKDGNIEYNMKDSSDFEKYLTKKLSFFLAPFLMQVQLNAKQSADIVTHHKKNFK